MKKKIIILLLAAFLLVPVSGCKKEVTTSKPLIWWGKAGDENEWNKAKDVMLYSDWIVISKDLYLDK